MPGGSLPPSGTNRDLAKTIVGAATGGKQAGRPTPPPQKSSSTRGQVDHVDANGTPWITINGTDTLVPTTVSHAPTGLKGGDVVDVNVTGTKVVITGRAVPGTDTGLTPFPTYKGPFAPNGVQKGNIGDTYLEESNHPNIWRKTTEGGNTGWVNVGSSSFRFSQTFSITNPATVGFCPPFFMPVPENQVVVLVGFRCMVKTGSGTFDLIANGEVFASSKSVGTSPVTYDFDKSVADNDYFGIQFDSGGTDSSRLMKAGADGAMAPVGSPFGGTGFSGSYFFDVFG